MPLLLHLYCIIFIFLILYYKFHNLKASHVKSYNHQQSYEQ